MTVQKISGCSQLKNESEYRAMFFAVLPKFLKVTIGGSSLINHLTRETILMIFCHQSGVRGSKFQGHSG